MRYLIPFILLTNFLLYSQSQQWIVGSTGISDDLYSVFFIDSNTGIAAGQNNTVIKTTNGGMTWYRVLGDGTHNNITYTNIYFIDDNIGFITSAGGGRRSIIKTTDRGETWFVIYETPELLWGISFSDINNGFAIGDGGFLIFTRDQGQDWKIHPQIGNIGDPKSIFLLKNLGWIVGLDGKVFFTSDSGMRWNLQNSRTNNHLFSVFFNKINNVVYSTGQNGTVINSSDYGKNWNQVAFSYTSTLKSISFRDASFGTIVGNDGSIFTTTNGGQSWFKEKISSSYSLNSVFWKGNKGYIVGNKGTFFYWGNPVMSNTSIDELNSSIYPNPFNPSTKIRYNIPSVILSSSKDDKVGVTLKVYDVLGNEVATLVNENKPAGVYEIEFNASKYNLTSGIYFYKLVAGSFVQTKKMILTK